MKKWALRLLISISGAFALLLLGVVWVTQTGSGRGLTENFVKSYAREHYQIELSYDELAGGREGSAYQFGVKNLRLRRIDTDDVPPLLVKELNFTTKSLAFWNKDAMHASLQIKGLTVDALLRDVELRFPSLAIAFTADDLQDYLGKTKGEGSPEPFFKEIVWQDIKLNLRYGYGERFEDLVLDSTGSWIDGSLQNLDLKGSRFDLAWFLSTARKLSAHASDPKTKISLSASSRIKAGSLDQFAVRCPNLETCSGQVQLQGLTSEGDKWIPGVEGFDAKLNFDAKHLNLEFPHEKFLLHYPYVSPKPIETLLKTSLAITLSTDTIIIDLPRSSLELDEISVLTSTHVEIPRKSPSTSKLAIHIEGRSANLMTVFHRLPAELIGDKAKSWLVENFSGGKVGAFTVSVEGTLPATPLVKVNANFRQAKLRYLKGWPLLTDCEGQFVMNGLEMNIPIKKCLSNNVAADDGQVRIHGIENDDAQISVKVRAKSNVTNAFQYLVDSPLKKLGAAFLAVPVVGREQTTTLAIQAPLSSPSKRESTLEGRTVLRDLTLDMANGIYGGTSPEISLSFDKGGLKDLSAEIINQADHSVIHLNRDDKTNSILGTIAPKRPKPDALKGQFHLSPAASPDLLTAQVSGYKLKGKTSPITLDSLRWHMGEKQSLAMKGQAEVDDFGAITKAVGLGDKFQKGKGHISFDLSLSDLKESLGAKAIDGILQIDIKDGKVSELPHTAVTMIDFANLKILGIKSDTLSYEYIKGEILFNRGLLTISKTELGMGIVDIKMAGTINYRSQSLNLNLQVIPNLGSPAAALLIGIWNPIVGLGLFAASQFQSKSSDSPLNRIVSQTYKIDGPIDDSEIHLIRPLNLGDIWGD